MDQLSPVVSMSVVLSIYLSVPLQLFVNYPQTVKIFFYFHLQRFIVKLLNYKYIPLVKVMENIGLKISNLAHKLLEIATWKELEIFLGLYNSLLMGPGQDQKQNTGVQREGPWPLLLALATCDR